MFSATMERSHRAKYNMAFEEKPFYWDAVPRNKTTKRLKGAFLTSLPQKSAKPFSFLETFLSQNHCAKELKNLGEMGSSFSESKVVVVAIGPYEL